MLYCDEPPPPAMGTMLDEGNILSLGTFSKIMAPALRLGWIQGSPKLVERILQSGFVNSGGSINHFTSEIMRHALELGLQQETLEHLRPAYRIRLEAMDDALHTLLGDRAQWTRPNGGYFFWLELDHDIDTAVLKERALAAGTGFQPGTVFSCDGGFSHFIRLSFAHYSEQEITTGIERLAGLLS